MSGAGREERGKFLGGPLCSRVMMGVEGGGEGIVGETIAREDSSESFGVAIG
jgi:hypothetical protein